MHFNEGGIMNSRIDKIVCISVYLNASDFYLIIKKKN